MMNSYETKQMNHNFFAIYYHNSLNLPIVMEIKTEEKFFELCETFPTDWAHLFDKNTGEIIFSYSVEDVSWRNN